MFYFTSPYSSGKRHTVWKGDALPEQTSDTLTLTERAVALAQAGYLPGFGYRKAGVILSGIVPGGEGERDLFAGTGVRESLLATLIATLDGLERRFGKNTVRVATARFIGPPASTTAGDVRDDSLLPCSTESIRTFRGLNACAGWHR